jgi:hypothetical protein
MEAVKINEASTWTWEAAKLSVMTLSVPAGSLVEGVQREHLVKGLRLGWGAFKRYVR